MIPPGAMLILPPIDSGTTALANFDRGVYEPSNEARDGLRVFDGSEEEEDVEGSRLPLLIVLALLVLAMFAGVVWLAYTQGVARGRGETGFGFTIEIAPARFSHHRHRAASVDEKPLSAI